VKKSPGALAVISVLLGGLLLAYWLVLPSSHSDFEKPPLFRIRNAAVIGSALMKYEYDHEGRLPDYLSDLIPKYVEPGNIRFFFPLGGSPTVSVNAPVSTSFLHAVDEEGAYVYLGESGLPQDLILYERSKVWLADKAQTNVITVGTNFTPTFRSPQDLEARVSNLSGLPKRQ
jgi:hypothetical protein